MGALKMENMKLLQELIESQKSYQTLLQQILDEQRAQVNTLTRLCENINRKTIRQESGYNSSISGNMVQPAISLIVSDSNSSAVPCTDQALVEWLQNLQIDEASIERFMYEQYTLKNVLEHVSRDDIRRLNLRGGIELRIWQAIMNHRQNND